MILCEARRSLAWTYPYSYLLKKDCKDKNDYTKVQVFLLQQSTMERHVETVSFLVN